MLPPVFCLSGCRVFFSSRLELVFDRSRYMKSGSSVSSDADAVDEDDEDAVDEEDRDDSCL